MFLSKNIWCRYKIYNLTHCMPTKSHGYDNISYNCFETNLKCLCKHSSSSTCYYFAAMVTGNYSEVSYRCRLKPLESQYIFTTPQSNIHAALIPLVNLSMIMIIDSSFRNCFFLHIFSEAEYSGKKKNGVEPLLWESSLMCCGRTMYFWKYIIKKTCICTVYSFC